MQVECQNPSGVLARRSARLNKRSRNANSGTNTNVSCTPAVKKQAKQDAMFKQVFQSCISGEEMTFNNDFSVTAIPISLIHTAKHFQRDLTMPPMYKGLGAYLLTDQIIAYKSSQDISKQETIKYKIVYNQQEPLLRTIFDINAFRIDFQDQTIVILKRYQTQYAEVVLNDDEIQTMFSYVDGDKITPKVSTDLKYQIYSFEDLTSYKNGFLVFFEFIRCIKTLEDNKPKTPGVLYIPFHVGLAHSNKFGIDHSSIPRNENQNYQALHELLKLEWMNLLFLKNLFVYMFFSSNSASSQYEKIKILDQLATTDAQPQPVFVAEFIDIGNLERQLKKKKADAKPSDMKCDSMKVVSRIAKKKKTKKSVKEVPVEAEPEGEPESQQILVSLAEKLPDEPKAAQNTKAQNAKVQNTRSQTAEVKKVEFTVEMKTVKSQNVVNAQNVTSSGKPVNLEDLKDISNPAELERLQILKDNLDLISDEINTKLKIIQGGKKKKRASK